MTRARAWLAGSAVAIAVAVVLAWGASGGGSFWPRWVWLGVGTAVGLALAVPRAWGVADVRRRWLAVDGVVLTTLVVVDVLVWAMAGGGFFWPAITLVLCAVVYAAHAWLADRVPERVVQQLTDRVDSLTRTRAMVVADQDAELRRVERDLHDGAQARIVALAMHLGLAEEALARDPEAATAMLRDARAGAMAALDDMRRVMHGIAPAVLADRGLLAAVRALDLPLPVAVEGAIDVPLDPANGSAAYFAVAECLTNVIKHSGADRARVDLATEPSGSAIVVLVSDDGVGGADPRAGSGLRGVARRLEAVDGTLDADSPMGGPTVVTLRIPASGSSRVTAAEG